MDFNFTGSSRPQRTINLGGKSQPKSVADIAAQARAARANRQQHRHHVMAATRLQSFYRAHLTSRAWRLALAQEFDEMFPNIADHDSWIHVTRLAVFCQSPNTLEHVSRLAAWAPYGCPDGCMVGFCIMENAISDGAPVIYTCSLFWYASA